MEQKNFRYDKLQPHGNNFYVTNKLNARFLLISWLQNRLYISLFVFFFCSSRLFIQNTPEEHSVLIILELTRCFQRFPLIFRARSEYFHLSDSCVYVANFLILRQVRCLTRVFQAKYTSVFFTHGRRLKSYNRKNKLCMRVVE